MLKGGSSNKLDGVVIEMSEKKSKNRCLSIKLEWQMSIRSNFNKYIKCIYVILIILYYITFLIVWFQANLKNVLTHIMRLLVRNSYYIKLKFLTAR